MATEDVHDSLLADYSQSIDTSTVLAILSDFNLNEEVQVATARQTLDLLKESVLAEGESGFDASAAAGDPKGNPFAGYRSDSVSTRSAPAWASNTDSTSISHDTLSDLEGLSYDPLIPPSSSNGDEAPGTPFSSQLDILNDEGKENALIAIFPALKAFDIKWTLKKCNWDASLAIDELMTQSFLEESGTRHMGIEAFSEATPSKPRRKKKKKKKYQSHEEYVKKFGQSSPAESKWETGKQDIEFISEKTGMPIVQISSIYHKNGASVQDTISSIIKAHAEMNVEHDDPVTQINAYEIQQEYPSLPLEDLESLLQLTHPSVNDAKELAKALAVGKSSGKPGGIEIQFRHAPPVTDDLPNPLNTKSMNRSHPAPQLDFNTASTSAQNLRLARETAHTQASFAYRKAKSDPLMGAAAGYYSQIGRDLGDRARGMESMAADALVANQSSKTQLDLHGVGVKDAVRISREKVTGWWHELGEQKTAPGGFGGGFKIVTGLGKHSEGGKGKLGPAVGKMLIREGWKVEVGSGSLVVRGVVRK